MSLVQESFIQKQTHSTNQPKVKGGSVQSLKLSKNGRIISKDYNTSHKLSEFTHRLNQEFFIEQVILKKLISLYKMGDKNVSSMDLAGLRQLSCELMTEVEVIINSVGKLQFNPTYNPQAENCAEIFNMSSSSEDKDFDMRSSTSELSSTSLFFDEDPKSQESLFFQGDYLELDPHIQNYTEKNTFVQYDHNSKY